VTKEELRELRETAVKNGLCYMCRARPRKGEARNCADCIARATAYKKANAGKRCKNCGARSYGKWMCPSCTATRNAQRMSAEASKIAGGTCRILSCENEIHPTSRSLCLVHLEEKRVAGAKAQADARRAQGVEILPWDRHCSVCGEIGHNRRLHARDAA
jgi:hypothetical protein